MEEIRKGLSKKHIEFIHSLGVDPNDISGVFEVVLDVLGRRGFDKNYQPNETGVLCEEILDLLPEIDIDAE
ncbi:MAG: hypothetical protein Q4F09_04600 [Erysipelotrichaceae bacterium]|nr:hypothetical protein [Erysipelotrichaceae bacterium]